MNILEVRGLKKKFNLEAGFFARFGRFVYAVNDVSFSIGEGETYGLVGESGCGKTTTARLLVRMYEADSGEILLRESIDVRSLRGNDLRRYREKIKYVFQDPARSLNPRLTVHDVLVSGYRWASSWPGRKRARAEAEAMMEEVGLSAADLDRRPADFSGGQRQRISIARGLIMKPDLLVCDEVVSALDVSIQGQILNLLLDIRERRGLSILFIAHDLKVACYFCDRIGVMYRGEMMEEAPARDLYRSALHPYTKLLFASAGGTAGSPVSGSAAPGAGPAATGGDAEPAGDAANAKDPGELRTPVTALSGCAFADRCPVAGDRCRAERPEYREVSAGHKVRCFLA